MKVTEALDMYEAYKTYWSENYTEANIDLKMAAGDPATHWGDAYALRKNAKKLVMVVNELPQYIHQVTNDIRQNTPSIKVIPDGEGNMETADAFSGLIRSIEYKSCADEAYDTAAEYAVKCGIGFIRIDHGYCDDEGELQELQIKSVPDPLSVYLDPASVECDGRDSMGVIFLDPITKREFERLYPGKTYSSFIDPKAKVEDSIVLAEIFVKEVTGGDIDKQGKRNPRKTVIKRYRFSGDALLAETTFPGKYIPAVPVYGEVVWIDGKRIIASLIRQARDPQLRLNHWACKEQELLNFAPIAPVMAQEGTLVNDRNQWQSPGSEMVLEYRRNGVDGEPANKPERLQPPPIPTGIINAMQGAKDNIKESMGIYAAGLGKREGDASGRALNALQQEGDVATFHFPDNVRRSINQCGRVLVDAAPEIYDTPRVVQIVNEETEPQMVSINGEPMQQGQEHEYDLRTGKYHVRVTTGASYTTKRQEAAQLFGDVLKGNPELMAVIGDLWAKNLDVAGAEAMASRLKKTINPALLDDKDKPPQDPRVPQLEQALQQAQMQMQGMAQELQKNNIEQQKLALDARKLDLEEQKLKTESFKVKAEVLQPMMKGETEPQPELSPDMEDDDILMLMQAEASKDETERQLKVAELAQREQQGQQIVTALAAIVQTLENMNRPKQVMRDPQTGAIVGVQ